MGISHTTFVDYTRSRTILHTVRIDSSLASVKLEKSQVTVDFFVRFYRNLKQGFDVAGALQATQIESLEHAGPAASPRVWGAFEVIGGGEGDGSKQGGHTGPPLQSKPAVKEL